MALTFDWQTLSAGSGANSSSGQFWLAQTPPPVSAVDIPPSKVANWEFHPGAPSLVSARSRYTADLSWQPSTTYLRLDVNMLVHANGASSGLEIHQLIAVTSQGVANPVKYSIDTRQWSAGAKGPTRPAGSGALARRQVLGTHPQLSFQANTIKIDARFLDVTELWWATHPDEVGRYTQSGKMENLRVLAWTGGDLPMLWFAVLSDKAVTSLASPDLSPGASKQMPARSPGRGPADIVWIRPVAGMNAIRHPATRDGFENPLHHHDTPTSTSTWWNLSRWLLSSVPKGRFAGDGVADQVQHHKGIALAETLHNTLGHRPVGLERALTRTGRADVLFLPLVQDDSTSADGKRRIDNNMAVWRKGLAGRVSLAMRLLWGEGAAGRADAAPPAAGDGRVLWVAAHSGGNGILARAVQHNAVDVSRVMSHEPSGDKALDEVVRVVTYAAATRTKTARPQLEAVFVVTPHTSGDSAGLTASEKKQTDGTGARVLYLPDPKEAKDFWRFPPKARTPAKAAGVLGTQSATDMIEDSSNPYLRYFLEQFAESELFDAKGIPAASLRDIDDFSNSRYMLHEMALYAGHLDPITLPNAPDPPRTTRTLLEDTFAPF